VSGKQRPSIPHPRIPGEACVGGVHRRPWDCFHCQASHGLRRHCLHSLMKGNRLELYTGTHLPHQQFVQALAGSAGRHPAMCAGSWQCAQAPGSVRRNPAVCAGSSRQCRQAPSNVRRLLAVCAGSWQCAQEPSSVRRNPAVQTGTQQRAHAPSNVAGSWQCAQAPSNVQCAPGTQQCKALSVQPVQAVQSVRGH
jgi:hypothetical protein